MPEEVGHWGMTVHLYLPYDLFSMFSSVISFSNYNNTLGFVIRVYDLNS